MSENRENFPSRIFFIKYRTEKDTSLQVSTFVYLIITTVMVIYFYKSWLKFWQIQYHLLTAYKPLQVPVESRLFTSLVKFNINADEISWIIWSSYCFLIIPQLPHGYTRPQCDGCLLADQGIDIAQATESYNTNIFYQFFGNILKLLYKHVL